MTPNVESGYRKGRLGRAAVFGSLALAALASSGCRSSRSSLRPIYVPPATPATLVPANGGCASGNCGATTTRIVPGPGPAPAPGFDEGSATLSPPSVPAYPAEPAPPASARPSTPHPDEPSLEPVTPGTGDNSGNGPPLNQPNTARSKPRPSNSGRLTLQDRVEPFVNDPGDLFQPPKADRRWRYIVLHHSAHAEGSYAQIDRDHRKTMGTQGCGYHFVVGNGSESPDGQIEVARRWADQKGGAHCRDARDAEMNDYGIGICLVGDLDNGQPSARQLEATKALVAYLRDRYRIPAENVGTHAALAQNPTACPGKNFPVASVTNVSRRNLAAN